MHAFSYMGHPYTHLEQDLASCKYSGIVTTQWYKISSLIFFHKIMYNMSVLSLTYVLSGYSKIYWPLASFAFNIVTN